MGHRKLRAVLHEVISGAHARYRPRRSVIDCRKYLTNGRPLIMTTELDNLPKVQIVRPHARGPDDQTGYDLLFPIGGGNREQWTNEIDTIYLTGVPRALRRSSWVYLKQGRAEFVKGVETSGC